jgi:hypothetical protein
MQAALDRIDAYTEHLRDLWSRQALDVPQDEHLAVPGIEGRNGRFDRSAELALLATWSGIRPPAGTWRASS